MINNDDDGTMTGRRMVAFFFIGLAMWAGAVAIGMWIIR